MKKPKKPTRRETTQAVIETALRAGLDLDIETSWYGRAARVETRRRVVAGEPAWTATQESPRAGPTLSASIDSASAAEVAWWVTDRITSITHAREAIKLAEKARKGARV